MPTTTKLLLIEDNRSIANALSQALQTEYVIDCAYTGKKGLYASDTQNYVAIILDLCLPDIPGTAVCQQLRERGCNAPILILSGENSVMSKIQLLDLGANDYVTKPFSLGELKARLRNLIRQHDPAIPRSNIVELGTLHLNAITRQVTRDGQIISLRRKEFAILQCLMTYPNTVVSRKSLIRYAWDENDDNWTNTIDVHIKHLRDKIDRPFETALITTVHGVGYRLDVPQAQFTATPQPA